MQFFYMVYFTLCTIQVFSYKVGERKLNIMNTYIHVYNTGMEMF
jgi:hypothetical protein